MVTRSEQTWEVGRTVRVGFLRLTITEKVPTPGDRKPDAYRLTDNRGRAYRFTPYNGLEREV